VLCSAIPKNTFRPQTRRMRLSIRGTTAVRLRPPADEENAAFDQGDDGGFGIAHFRLTPVYFRPKANTRQTDADKCHYRALFRPRNPSPY
jgi:hypothetical protein